MNKNKKKKKAKKERNQNPEEEQNKNPAQEDQQNRDPPLNRTQPRNKNMNPAEDILSEGPSEQSPHHVNSENNDTLSQEMPNSHPSIKVGNVYDNEDPDKDDLDKEDLDKRPQSSTINAVKLKKTWS